MKNPTEKIEKWTKLQLNRLTGNGNRQDHPTANLHYELPLENIPPVSDSSDSLPKEETSM